MHDPMTVAFDIRLPLFWRESWRRPTIMTIWHVDPEADGSDDSCGWSYPKLTSKQCEILGLCAYHEARQPWFQRDPVKRIGSAADAECLLRGVIMHVAKRLRIRMTFLEASELACNMAHNTIDNFQGSLCHLPGWHTNFQEDLVSERERHAEGLFCSVARILLGRRRSWYRHPRWHFWHWSIQVPFIQNVKRWMFSRCCKCGQGFRFGEAPVTNNWNGSGPKWFKSESDVYHTNGCAGSTGESSVGHGEMP